MLTVLFRQTFSTLFCFFPRGIQWNRKKEVFYFPCYRGASLTFSQRHQRLWLQRHWERHLPPPHSRATPPSPGMCLPWCRSLLRLRTYNDRQASLLQSSTPSEPPQKNKRKTSLQLQIVRLCPRRQSVLKPTLKRSGESKPNTNKSSLKNPRKQKEKRERARVLQTLNEAPRLQGKTWNHLVRWSIQGTVDSRRGQGTTSWVVFVERAERSNDCTVEMNLVGDLKISNSLVTNLSK